MIKPTLYILVDASEQMRPYCDNINKFMKELYSRIIPEKIECKDAEIEPYLAVLTFKTGSHDNNAILEWLIPKCRMENVNEWVELDQEFFAGEAPTSAAIEMAINDIEEGCYGDIDPYATLPAIMLLTNGVHPCEEEHFLQAMKRYTEKDSKWYSPDFAHAIRIACGFEVDEHSIELLQIFRKVSRSYLAMREKHENQCCDAGFIPLTNIIVPTILSSIEDYFDNLN